MTQSSCCCCSNAKLCQFHLLFQTMNLNITGALGLHVHGNATFYPGVLPPQTPTKSAINSVRLLSFTVIVTAIRIRRQRRTTTTAKCAKQFSNKKKTSSSLLTGKASAGSMLLPANVVQGHASSLSLFSINESMNSVIFVNVQYRWSYSLSRALSTRQIKQYSLSAILRKRCKNFRRFITAC